MEVYLFQVTVLDPKNYFLLDFVHNSWKRKIKLTFHKLCLVKKSILNKIRPNLTRLRATVLTTRGCGFIWDCSLILNYTEYE